MLWIDQLRRQLLRFVRSFQYALQRRRLIRARNHENHLRRVVHGRRRQRNALSVKFADPVAHNQPAIIPQSLRSRKEGKRMAFVSHAEKNKVKWRSLPVRQMKVRTQLLFVLASGLRSE